MRYLVSHITFAHEIGHNFGSPHDDISCSPGESSDPSKKSKGNYIMYRNAVNGKAPNNNKFSQCSKFDVLSKLLACGRSSFEKRNEDECGNYKIDGGEQCDQGFGVTGKF